MTRHFVSYSVQYFYNIPVVLTLLLQSIWYIHKGISGPSPGVLVLLSLNFHLHNFSLVAFAYSYFLFQPFPSFMILPLPLFSCFYMGLHLPGYNNDATGGATSSVNRSRPSTALVRPLTDHSDHMSRWFIMIYYSWPSPVLQYIKQYDYSLGGCGFCNASRRLCTRNLGCVHWSSAGHYCGRLEKWWCPWGRQCNWFALSLNAEWQSVCPSFQKAELWKTCKWHFATARVQPLYDVAASFWWSNHFSARTTEPTFIRIGVILCIKCISSPACMTMCMDN